MDIFHYPVTTTFWRGVWSQQRLTRALRRACDWKEAKKEEVLDPSMTEDQKLCPDCEAYVEALVRLKKI